MLYDLKDNKLGRLRSMDKRLATVAETTAENGDLASELMRRGRNSGDPVLKEALFYLAGTLPNRRVSGADFAELLDRAITSTRTAGSELMEVAVGAFHEARVFGKDRILN